MLVSALLNALLVSGLGKKWTPQKHLRMQGSDVPCVDVFLPCYGESLQIISDTINRAIRQDYPADKFRVVILDDGGSQAVEELVAEIKKQNPSVSPTERNKIWDMLQSILEANWGHWRLFPTCTDE